MRHNSATGQQAGARRTVEGQKQRRWRMRPTLLALEERTLLSTIVVNNPTDTPVVGQIDLRQAIVLANTTGGAETINFDSTVFKTPQTITLGGRQLELSDTTGAETITGPNKGVAVSGGGLSRVFQVDGLVTASISGLTITGGNTAGFGGGGGLLNYGTATLTNCTLNGNTARGNGGGVQNYGTLALSNCTVSDNSTDSLFGGGVFNADGTLALTNCTVSGNSAYIGGGLSGYSLSAAILTNCTVSGNSAFAYGGGLVCSDFTDEAPILANTIVAGNTDSEGRRDVVGVVISQGNNLIGEADFSSGWVGSDLTGTNAQPLNAELAPLGNYGGPTQTFSLLPGSPAIGGGSNALLPAGVTTDQRGLPRIVNGIVDIGAFESEGFTLTPVAGSTPQTSKIGTPFANPLAVTVTANNPSEPVNGGVISFVANRAVTGATAMLLAPSAVIGGGQAAISAAPNNAVGSYTVLASTTGSPSASFALTNAGPVFTHLIVNTTSDVLFTGTGLLSLREAIAFANLDSSGISTITFDTHVFATPQTITLNGSQLELSNTSEKETITGPKAGVTVSGGGNSRVLQVDANVTASISGTTISGGNATSYRGYHGGGVNNSGSLALTDCTVSGNTGEFGGGLDNTGTATLTNCTVSGNTANEGGGVDNIYGTAMLTNCTLNGNSAYFYGGGLHNTGTATLTNCTVSGNTANAGGGFSNYGSLALANCKVNGNTATGEGGGLRNAGTATLTNCTVTGNTAEYGGGFSNYGSLALANCKVSGNTATVGEGGGLDNAGTATLTNCTVAGNSSANFGGGLFNWATATLTNCTVSGNTADDNGGGLDNYGAATLTNCTVSGNTAYGGGGVDNAGTAMLTNCTVSGNSAVTGGGISNSYGTLNVASSKIINNQAIGGAGGAGIGGGILNNVGGSLALRNSALSGNKALGGAGASGGAGGDGIGGGLTVENNSTATITNTSFLGNLAQGGAGGGGANGGDGIGGGIAVAIGGASDTSSVSLSNTSLILNVAQGGKGGKGGNGGNGEGGGAFIGAAGSASFDQSDVLLNMALGGLAGAGGSNGDGIGGGLYVTTGGVVTLHKTTVALNFASFSNGNIYGAVSYV